MAPTKDPNWHDGRLARPHFIFLKTLALTPEHLMRVIGYPHARPCDASSTGAALLLTRCAAWTHIADDWLYTLWHRPDRLQLYERLSHEAMLFTFAVGDTDASYAFALYDHGQVVRRRVVVSPDYTGRVVRENIGSPLPREDAWLHQSDGFQIGVELAAGLGIGFERRLQGPLLGYSIDDDERGGVVR